MNTSKNIIGSFVTAQLGDHWFREWSPKAQVLIIGTKQSYTYYTEYFAIAKRENGNLVLIKNLVLRACMPVDFGIITPEDPADVAEYYSATYNDLPGSNVIGLSPNEECAFVQRACSFHQFDIAKLATFEPIFRIRPAIPCGTDPEEASCN